MLLLLLLIHFRNVTVASLLLLQLLVLQESRGDPSHSMLRHEFPFQHPLQKVLEGVSVRHVLPEKVEILWRHRINQISPSEDYFFRELKRRRLFQLCLFCFWLQIVLSLPLAGPGAHLMPGQGLVLHDDLDLQGLVLHDDLDLQGLVLKDALVFQDSLGQLLLFLHGGGKVLSKADVGEPLATGSKEEGSGKPLIKST